MLDDVHIEVSPVVREQLGRLDLADRKAIVEGLYELVPLERGPVRRPGLASGHFVCVVLGYIFEYRKLSSAELNERGRQSGYRVVVMKAPGWWHGTDVEPALAEPVRRNSAARIPSAEAQQLQRRIVTDLKAPRADSPAPRASVWRVLWSLGDGAGRVLDLSASSFHSRRSRSVNDLRRRARLTADRAERDLHP